MRCKACDNMMCENEMDSELCNYCKSKSKSIYRHTEDHEYEHADLTGWHSGVDNTKVRNN